MSMLLLNFAVYHTKLKKYMRSPIIGIRNNTIYTVYMQYNIYNIIIYTNRLHIIII